MDKTRNRRYYLIWGIGFVLSILVIVFGYYSVRNEEITFIDDINAENTDVIEDEFIDKIRLNDSREYQSWKRTTDTSFVSLYNGTQSVDLLAARPDLVILWAGYGFAKSYLSPRGHMYALDDLHTSLRTGAPKGKEDGPQPASCWACKSSDVPRLISEVGQHAFYKKKWSAWGSEVVNPVSCMDCHDPSSMELRVSRSFLIDACKRRGMSLENTSEQEMRSLICAQCHAEYYFAGEDNEVVLPWDYGYSVEAIEKYYDQINFSDFTHKLSRTPLLKAQHPDYELAQMGIHARRGVACEECHMPYVGNEEKGYNDHHIQSPLAMIDRTCQACHRESEETLRQDVYDRQNKAVEIRNRLEDELVKAHIEAKFAWDMGATQQQMENVLKLIRQAQWRWGFASTSHGAAFHAPQEVQRIFGDGIDKAMQARMAIMKILVKLGYTKDVPMPDISTKEKAQKYIGLDMVAENAAKEEFLKTVLPQWLEEAKANKRLIEER